MPFALLRFPRLVQKEIMENLDPLEIFDLSECSKRALSVARLKNMKEFMLEITVRSKEIQICGPDFKSVGFTFKKSQSKDSIRYLPSEKPDEAMPALLEKILNIFGISQVQNFYSSDKNFKLFASISEILIQRKCEIGLMYFSVEKVEEERLMHILNNLTISNYLRFHTNFQFSPKFDYKPIKYPNLLSIEYSFWFGLDELFSAVKSCLKVQITNSSLKIKDLNEFLEKWKAGEIQNRTAFAVSIYSDNFIGDEPVLGMELPIMGARNWEISHGVISAKVRYGRLIKNINGEEAVIELIYDRFLFLAST
ncbi:unnamed protein product [Caenorhabditis nigoni]